MTPVPIRPAATVVLVRDAVGGPEIFLVQRHRRSGFLPQAWVFPGGRVDPGDAEVPVHHAPWLGRLPDLEARAAGVAAVRETLEEAQIWLGGGEPPPWPPSSLDLGGLVPWSRWVTPEIEPKRFDTVFFVARTDQPGQHDAHETVASGWFRPSDVLQPSSGMGLAPPTWWTLRELAAFADANAMVDAAATRDLQPVRPILEFGDQGIVLFLAGHPRHPDRAVEGMPDRVEFRDGGWQATRAGVPLAQVPHLNT